MPLPEGTWTVNVNGTLGELHLLAPTAAGNVQGSLFGMPLRGLWREAAQSIDFLIERPIFSPDPIGTAPSLPGFLAHMFRGHLFSTPATPQPGQDIVWTLAGTVTDAAGHSGNGVSGNSRRNEFGWFAQLTQLV
jgi:hypothetical protein